MIKFLYSKSAFINLFISQYDSFNNSYFVPSDVDMVKYGTGIVTNVMYYGAKDVPEGEIWAGTPAKLLKPMNKE